MNTALASDDKGVSSQVGSLTEEPMESETSYGRFGLEPGAGAIGSQHNVLEFSSVLSIGLAGPPTVPAWGWSRPSWYRRVSDYLQPVVDDTASEALVGPGDTADDSDTVTSSDAEDLLSIPDVAVESTSLVSWLDSANLLRGVLSTIHQLMGYIPAGRFLIRQGPNDPESEWLEPVRIYVSTSGNPEAFYDALSQFDYNWWLKQDPEFRDQVGVYVA